MAKFRWYVGFKDGKREAFRSAQSPTELSHGALYFAVMGPFKTMRAARWTATQLNNPHVRHVNDAERIAAQLHF